MKNKCDMAKKSDELSKKLQKSCRDRLDKRNEELRKKRLLKMNCNSCGAHFDKLLAGEKGHMKCPWCDGLVTIAEAKK